MRAEFPGYYPPTETDYKSLLKEAIIVLDTNVLLDLYRLPDQSRSELVETIEKVSERLWIPFQVALEFQRSRLSVIFNERKRTEDVLSSMQRITDDLRAKIENLQIEKRDIAIEDGGLLKELEAAHEGIKNKIEAVRAKQTDISSDDPIRDRLDKILNGKVGPPPKDQAELDHLCRDGGDRYQNKIPPGFQDSEKSRDESQSYYFHDHLKYESRFGDLIVWRQIIERAKSPDNTKVILITSEKKDDWWRREYGRVLGPHPELINEITRESGLETFWMYSPAQFLRQMKEYSGANISPQSIHEIEKVFEAEHSIAEEPWAAAFKIHSEKLNYRPDRRDSLMMQRGANELFFQELKKRYRNVLVDKENFDFLINTSEGVIAYTVRYYSSIESFMRNSGGRGAHLKGYAEQAQRRIEKFRLVVIFDEDELELSDHAELNILSERIERNIEMYPIDSVTIGYLNVSGFNVFLKFGEEI